MLITFLRRPRQTARHCEEATCLKMRLAISAHQLHRILEVTYKTGWFMEHRIREAMGEGVLAPFGAGGGAVEIDETFIGNDRTIKAKGRRRDAATITSTKFLPWLIARAAGRAAWSLMT